MGIHTIACRVPLDQRFFFLELKSLSTPFLQFVVLRECVQCPPSEGRLILLSQFLTFSTRNERPHPNLRCVEMLRVFGAKFKVGAAK
jgi:hypothetical protein